MKIFVQIAAYRDPQLEPTIKNMLENAKRPKNLRVGICRQYNPDDQFDLLEEYRKDKRFRILDVLYSDSKGVCWARNQVQQLYEGEEYTLQIDWNHSMLAQSGYLQILVNGSQVVYATGNNGGYFLIDPGDYVTANVYTSATSPLIAESSLYVYDSVDGVAPCVEFGKGILQRMIELAKYLGENSVPWINIYHNGKNICGYDDFYLGKA